MRTITAIMLALGVAGGLLLSKGMPTDVGSCYSPQPICISGSPVCICDLSMNCLWACR